MAYETGTFNDSELETKLFDQETRKDLEKAYKEWLSLMETDTPPGPWTRDSERLFNVFACGYIRGRLGGIKHVLKRVRAKEKKAVTISLSTRKKR